MTHGTIESGFNLPDDNRRQVISPIPYQQERRSGDERRIDVDLRTMVDTIEFSVVEPGSEWMNGIPVTHSSETPTETAAVSPASAAVKEVENSSWIQRNSGKVYLGLAAAGLTGTVVGVANGSFSNIVEDVKEEAPWAVSAFIASEAVFVTGVAGMVVGAGKEIGNPLTLRSRKNEILASALDSKTFKAGLMANYIGAIGSAGVVAGAAVEALPPSTWPAALGWAAADVASTVATRAGAYKATQSVAEKLKSGGTESKGETESKIKTRLARPEDIDRLADIDLELFDKAYGAEKPSKQEVVDMLTRRLENGGDCMFVAEIGGRVEGFVSAFRTNKPSEKFSSWEESTNNGTLDGKVEPDGKYVYVTNMTIKPVASKAGAKEMLMANMFAYAIEAGIEYGYFESRMPMFKRWLDRQVKNGLEVGDQEALDSIAEQYMDLKIQTGKRYDPLLRMYEGFGYTIDRLVPDAFVDDASLGYGVICKAEVPPGSAMLKKIKPVRKAYAAALRLVAKSPTLIQKVL